MYLFDIIHFFNNNLIFETTSNNNEIRHQQNLEDLEYNLVRFIYLIYAMKLQINCLVVKPIAMHIIFYVQR